MTLNISECKGEPKIELQKTSQARQVPGVLYALGTRAMSHVFTAQQRSEVLFPHAANA